MKNFRSTMREFEDMVMDHNRKIAKISNWLHRVYQRKWWWIPRKIVWFNRSDIYWEWIIVHRMDEFWEWSCKRETFASKYEVDSI